MQDTICEDGLAILINESGKLRMLSHRTTMFIAMHLASEGQRSFETEIVGALATFEKIVATIRNGDPNSGVVAEVSRMLSGKQDAVVALNAADHFLRKARDVARRMQDNGVLDYSIVENLADFVANDLLQKLHGLNDRIRQTLNGLITERHGAEVTHRSSFAQKIEAEISEINAKIKIVSINAMIEAKRAGEHGRAFAVVANEVGVLSDLSTTVLNSFTHGTEDLKTATATDL